LLDDRLSEITAKGMIMAPDALIVYIYCTQTLPGFNSSRIWIYNTCWCRC